MLFVYHAMLVRMAATVNPPTQRSVTQTPTPSNCSTSGTLIIQRMCIFIQLNVTILTFLTFQIQL